MNAELRSALEGVGGWLSDEEATALYELARRARGRGCIVEIGSYMGRSTICLALGSRAGAGAPVYAIDPHRGPSLEDFLRNIERAGVADAVTPIRAASHEAHRSFAGGPVEVLFIDGNHTYPMVKRDVLEWVPRLVEGGFLAMHDTTNYPGSRAVAGEYVYRSRRFRDVRFVYPTMTVATRVAENRPLDRLRARWVLLVKRGFELFLGVRGHIPAPVARAGRLLIRAVQ
jgi:predicted O-methyltransferase YrrM